MIPSSLSENEASKAKYYLDKKEKIKNSLNFTTWTKYKSFEYKLAYNGGRGENVVVIGKKFRRKYPETFTYKIIDYM